MHFFTHFRSLLRVVIIWRRVNLKRFQTVLFVEVLDSWLVVGKALEATNYDCENADQARSLTTRVGDNDAECLRLVCNALNFVALEDTIADVAVRLVSWHCAVLVLVLHLTGGLEVVVNCVQFCHCVEPLYYRKVLQRAIIVEDLGVGDFGHLGLHSGAWQPGGVHLLHVWIERLSRLLKLVQVVEVSHSV